MAGGHGIAHSRAACCGSSATDYFYGSQTSEDEACAAFDPTRDDFELPGARLASPDEVLVTASLQRRSMSRLEEERKGDVIR
jgi:hypothetical protein